MKERLDGLRTLDTLITRGLDTIEDAFLLARRVTAEPVDSVDCLDAWTDDADERQRILVIGSGWAAHALVKIVDADLYRLLVVSPRNFFIFTPMLAASSVGTVEYRSITEPMRASNPRAAYIEGTVTDIDPVAQCADIRLGTGTGAASRQVNYDVCVYAAGVLASTSRIPGVAEHCCFLKEIEDAQKLRAAVGTALESASRPGLSEEERRRMLTLVVVGGGATGVEYVGELSDFLLDALTRLYPQLARFARVILVHSGPTLLPQFDPPLREKALATLQAKVDVEIMLNTRVERVNSPTSVTLKTRRAHAAGQAGTDADSGDVTADEWDAPRGVECGLVMWAAGTGPSELTERLNARLVDCAPPGTFDETAGRPPWTAGRITVDPWLRALGAPPGSLIALGDAAVCAGSDGSPLPQTAQVAAQQGAYVARLLNRGYDLTGGGPAALDACEVLSPPLSREARAGDIRRLVWLRGAVEARQFEFLNLGLLAYLGGGEALSQVQVGESRLLSEAGSTGFLLWRSVYVVKQVSPRTRFLVLFDWLKTKLFGRDVTRW